VPALAHSLDGPDILLCAPACPLPREWALCWLWAGWTADLARPSAACLLQQLARASVVIEMGSGLASLGLDPAPHQGSLLRL
jgi:hypothetical protein